MATVIVGKKGRITIPADLRRRRGIAPGCQLELVHEATTIRVFVNRTIAPTVHADGYGMLTYSGPARCLAQFDIAAAVPAAARSGVSPPVVVPRRASARRK